MMWHNPQPLWQRLQSTWGRLQPARGFSRARLALILGASLAALLLLSGVSALLILRSQWFYDRVRREIIATLETATGGRVEIGSFQFDWTHLRAEVRPLVLHGTEPSDKPPLLRVSSAAVGIKIISIWKRSFDVQYVEATDPRVYLIIYPDGRTNVPEPKIRKSDRNTVETILDLKIGRFQLRNGVFEVESRGKTPFDARGQNLNAHFLYELSGPRYRGDIAIQPLDLALPGHPAQGINVALQVAIEKNRLDISSANLSSGDSRVELQGSVDDWNSPHGAFRYRLRASLADVSHILRIPELERGTAEIGGDAKWAGGDNFSATGNLHAFGVYYRDSTFRLHDYRADGAVSANPHEIEVTGFRLSGSVSGAGGCRSGKLWPCPETRIPAEGHIARVMIRGRDLDLHGVALATLGGSFQGEALLRDLLRYTVEGQIAGFDARRTVAVYSPQALPWDALASGPVRLEGALGHKEQLQISANLTISPAAQGPPVAGQVTASYIARDSRLDLGRSTLSLPASRVEFSGALPATPGHELHARLETHNLNDFLPALGADAASVPVKLENGSAVFDGTITGTLDNPLIVGHLTATRFAYQGRVFDSLTGVVTANPNSIRIDNAALARGGLRAEFQAAIGPRDWKIEDASPIAAAGTIHNANLADVASLVGASIPATGTLQAKGELAGTIAKPLVNADLDLSKGSLDSEPFDRLTAHASYAERHIEVTSGQLTAGGKQLHISAAFDHAPDRLDTGHLRFRVDTNPMPLEQIQKLQEARPGAKGTVQVSAHGEADIVPPKDGGLPFRITTLEADVAARSLQFEGQPLGDAHLTAQSQNGVLHTHLESDIANSAVRGEGQWRLEGDYPGSATITFSKLDFAQLRRWISPAEQGSADRFIGSAEGQLRIEGPGMKPKLMKAELRIPKLEIAPAPGTGVPGSFKIENNGPIVATMSNSVLTVDSARLKGRGTDMQIAGRVNFEPRSALDLRVNGHIDLGVLRDFEPDLVSSGTAVADATIRGGLDAPQVTGRLQFQDAAFNLEDFPNGISKANATIAFAGDRATIQNFTGESGGGKIALFGFVAYGSETVFRLHLRADQVRVRKPEGVSTVANASLNLTGTAERSTVSGTITILRTGVNLQSDFGSLIAKSAQPVATPAVRTGFLGGLNFDVQIDTSPDIQFQSSLTEDLQVEANLKLRGNLSNPALLGRINITQGQVVFYGTKYTINQGSISFFSPVKIEPILDIDLETKARGIDVTLTVTGPLDKPKLTPRSDPPLQFSEIVALLATGRTPTSDPTLLAQQNTAPQSWQQTGATALLGQAIANPVSGRLQRFFGVSKLRIDPTLPGVENNPQARLTLEQQITPNITFTYITNVTSSNPLVVRMEWSFSKQWSVVALREENGTLGMDFFFKKRF